MVKTVCITGASSGIGYATAEAFAQAGCSLLLLARRAERLDALASQLEERFQVSVRTSVLDVTNRNAVSATFQALEAEQVQIDVLVNNAGLALSTDRLHEGSIDEWERLIDTNVKGLLYVTKAVLPLMVKRNHGHIINIGSIAGQECYPGGNVYCATKHAVRALSQSLRMDVLGTKVRVSSVNPGAVETEFSAVRWGDQDRANQFYAEFDALQANDVADAIVYCASTPEHVTIAEMLVMPTCQASASHIHKAHVE